MAETVVSKANASVTVAAPATDNAQTAIATTSISSVLSAASGANATGTITFKVFGPQASAPATCTSGGTTVGTATVSGNGTYNPSASYTPTRAGTYWWYVSYNGDGNNNADTSTCGAGMPSTVVSMVESSVASATSTTSGSSATTSSFTIKANTTYLLLVSRNPGAAGDSISSLSTTGFSTALTLASFTSVTSQTYNTNKYQWAYYVTTSGTESGAGTITVNFAKTQSNGNATIVDVVQIQGNNTASPIVTASEGVTNNNSGTATANLTAAPSASDGEIVLLSSAGSLGGSAPTTSGLNNVFYSGNAGGSAGIYTGIPAQQNSSFTITSQRWATLTLEIAS
jgi:hypothetical protein